MSVPTPLVKPNLRLAGQKAIQRTTYLMAGFCFTASVAFAYVYNYRRYVRLSAIDAEVNKPENVNAAYERAKKFKALRAFPGGVSGIREYWSGAH